MSTSRSGSRRPGRSLMPVYLAILPLALVPALPSAGQTAVVVLAPSKDNTLYQDGANNRSNGSGEYVFVGRTDQGNLRRALLQFDIAGSIPPGSTINSASLSLYASRAKVNTAYSLALHRAGVGWGEGTTNASGQEGGGANATAGDVTWFHRYYPDSTWTTPGGDFAPTASASTPVGANNQSYAWSSAGMAADVQAWLDTPGVNFGWVLLGGEATNQSAKRFNSRSNGTNPPRLTIDFTPPTSGATGACCFSDGSCAVVDSFTCALQGGTYQGDDTECTPDPCGDAPVTVTLLATLDNTLYEDAGGALSNGVGDYFFTGRNNASLRRRGVLAFSLADSVPVGAVVSSATLTLRTTQGGGGTFNVSAHRTLASWGEGTSNASGGEQNGAASTTGDATWIHRFYAATTWTTPGGDYSPTASATTAIGDQAFYSWTGTGVVADVQAWVDNPAVNHGWVLIGVENAGTTEKRFASRQYAADATYRPRLQVTFTVPPPDPTGACCFTDGTCDTLTEAACELQGGTYQGDGTSCTPGLCPLALEPFVDALTVPPIATPVSGVVGGVATYDMAMVEFQKKLHRDLPPTTVWGFDGRYPGPTIVASPGNPVTVNWTNDLRDSTGALRTTHYLPVDLCLHGPDTAGTGARTVVHLHGGHVPQSVDGHPDSTFVPGESRTYVYPNNQEASLIWYHDHALGTTRLNVMMGLAGGYVITDPVEQALNLPSGAYDVPLILQDRSFHPDGSLKYPAVWEEHFFGDVAVVNGTVWPYFNVDRGAYRLRLLNGSNSRAYRLTLSNGAPFTVIGNDGGLLDAPVPRDTLVITPGERIDTIVDFGPLAAGTEVILENSAPSPFPLGDPMMPALPQLMKFIVQPSAGYAFTPPAVLRPVDRLLEANADVERDFMLEKMTDPCTGTMWTINGLHWDHITEFPRLGDTEIWRFLNPSGVVHPMHLHLVFFQVLDRTPFTMIGDSLALGTPVPPDSSEGGWKDTVPVYPNEAVRVIARFEDYTGRYPYHCHILEHEDHEMMRQFEVVDTLVSAVPEVPRTPAARLALSPGYPNPTTGRTRITFELPVSGPARIDVFDVAGRLVATVFDGTGEAGRNEATWEARDDRGARVAAGLYIYRLSVPGHSEVTRKVLVLN